MENIFIKSKKFQQLIQMYKKMASLGYNRSSGEYIPSEKVYSDLEPEKHKEFLKDIFKKFEIKTILDYGSGKGDWNSIIDGKQTFKNFLGLKEVFQYEPALNKDEKTKQDCALSFDVLEHVFISDVPYVIYDLFLNAKKLVVLNVACYKAAALLPNGENAHVTVRHPLWWKGCMDTVAVNFPKIAYVLIASTSYTRSTIFPPTSHNEQIENANYVALEK